MLSIRRIIQHLFGILFLHTVFAIYSENDIQDLFRESKCIEEPTDDFFNQYLMAESENIISTSEEDENLKNYRNEINSLVQYHSLEYSYEVVDEKGPSHSKFFNVSLRLGDEVYYGVGRSKKQAKEMAATNAFKSTSYQKPPLKIKDEEKMENEGSTPTVVLNNIGAKNGYKINYYILDPLGSKRIINLNKVKDKSLFTNSSFWKEAAHLDEPPKSPFQVEVNVDDKSFYGKAHTIQEAKHNAASKAIQALKIGTANGPCGVKGRETECKAAKNKIKSPISLIYEFAQSKRLNVEFNEVSQTGPAHKPIFEFECVLGTYKISGEGKSKKEAKRIAAEKMLENISHLDFPSQENVESEEIASNKNKKAKRNKVKSSLEVAGDLVKNAMNFFGSSEKDDQANLDDENTQNIDKPSRRSKKKQQNKDKHRWSPKERLLNTGKALNLNIQFYSMPGKNSAYLSLLNLDLNPKYICIGTGPNVQISQEHNALNALKFLQKLDLLENTVEEDLDIERFSFDNYIWLTEDSSPKE